MGAQAREAAELGQKLREARARAKELGDAVERERQATALAASELEARALAAALPTLCPHQQLPLQWPDAVPAVQPWPCLPRSSAVFPATCCLRPPCRTVGGAAQARGADKDAAEARAARAEAESRDLAQRLMEMKGREARAPGALTMGVVTLGVTLVQCAVWHAHQRDASRDTCAPDCGMCGGVRRHAEQRLAVWAVQ